MNRWCGKVAVVTGASSGIGLATAKTLIRQGMTVVGLARREDKMIHEMKKVEGPGKFFPKKCDVSKEKEVIDAFDYVRQSFKTLSILVNNAGLASIKTIEASSTAELEQVIGVNLMGVLYCSKQGIKLMKENNNEGHIVNINSVAGFKVPHPNWFKGADVNVNVYSATKFAITALSETFMNELLGHQIRVTNVCPGFVITEMTSALTATEERSPSVGPALQAKDVADAVAYVIGTPSHVQISQLTIKPLGELF